MTLLRAIAVVRQFLVTASCCGLAATISAQSPTITLNIPQLGAEGVALLAGGMVSTTGTNHPPLTVNLFSSNTNRVQVVPFVIIPPGTNAARFDLVLPENDLIEGTENLFVEAWLGDLFADLDVIRVSDNESRALAVALPTPILEGNRTLTNAGKISFAGRTVTDVIVALQSDHSRLIAVPTLVTNQAGQSNVTFNVLVGNDGISNNFDSVRISASAPGFSGATNVMGWIDDELLIPAEPTPADGAVQVASTTLLRWKTGSNAPPGTTYDVYLGTSYLASSREYLGTTTGHVWTLPLLAPGVTYYWQVVAHPAAAIPGPLWHFTTRGLDHFEFDVIDRQFLNTPFPVAIAARDELNRLMTNFAGNAALSATIVNISTNTLLPSPTHTESATAVNSASFGYAFTPSANLRVTALRHYFGSKVSIWTDTGTLIIAQPIVRTNGTWQETPLPTPVTLIAGTRYRLAAYGQPSTVIFWHNRATSFANGTIDLNWGVNADAFPNAYSNAALTALVDLRYDVDQSVPGLISIANTGPFTNGRWTGTLASLRLATNLVLQANDGAGHFGESNPFNVYSNLAPLITAQPVARSTHTGTNVTFSVVARDAEAQNYQWRHGAENLTNDARISGANGPTLTINDLREEDAGSYSVIISNPFGTAMSTNVTLVVRALHHFSWFLTPEPKVVDGPFAATIEARDVSNRPVTNFAGPVALSATAEGRVTNSFLPPSSNIFSFFTASKTVGYSFTPSTDLIITTARHWFGAKISFWTDGGTLLSAQPLVSELGNWRNTPLVAPLLLKAGVRYRVAMQVMNGNYYGDLAVPVLFPHGTIHQSYEANGDSFPNITSGSLVWMMDLLYSVPVPVAMPMAPVDPVAFENGVWSGAITISFPATNVVLKADDEAGQTGQSQSFHVVPSGQSPVFMLWQASQLVRAGSNVTLSVSVFGTQPLTYQWRHNGTNLIDDGRINGATGTELSIANFQASDAGAYDAVAVNEFGRATNSAATLLLDTLDHFNWSIPGNPHKFIGQSFTVLIQALGSSNQLVTNCPGPSVWSGIGADGVTVTPIVAGLFNNAVWSGSITITKPVTNLVLRADDGTGRFGLSPPFHVAPSNQGPILVMAPTNQTVRVGGTARFYGSAYGGGNLTYSWSTNGSLVPNGPRVSGQNTTTFTISNVVENDAKIYGLTIGNGFGIAAVTNARLSVYRQNHFAWLPVPSPQSIYKHVPVTLEARDSSNVLVTNFNEAVSLSATLFGGGAPVPILPSTSSTFAAGVWNGTVSITEPVSNVVLRAEDALGNVGVSAPFNVERIVAFTLHPTDQNVLPGTNVTLVAAAAGTGVVRYQWRFKGTNIPNATNASYAFTGANITNHHGTFSCVAMDDLSTTVSSNANVYVLLKPGVVTHLKSASVLQGATAILSLVATGAPPMGYRWVRNSATFTNTSVPFLIVSNVQASANFRVVVTNLANQSGAFSPGPASVSNVTLTMLPDEDGDGIADAWELQYGFSPTNAVDALLDSDGDGMSNRDEYMADTNPTNAASVLRISLTTTNAGQLQFIAQSNIAYGVQFRAGLSTESWTNLTSLFAQPLVRTVQVSVPNPPPEPERFYRVVTPPVP